MSDPATTSRSSTVPFWGLAVLLGFFLFAASAPSPLYAIYARLFRFSPTTVTAIYAVYAAGALGALLVTGQAQITSDVASSCWQLSSCRSPG